MDEIQIAFSTGKPRIDALLHGLVSLYEMLFPDRIRAYYLVGSYYDGSATHTSDLDVMIIFRDAFLEGEEQRTVQTKKICRQIAPIHVDLPAFSEDMLKYRDNIGLKLGSTLIYGEDMRDQIALSSMETYLSDIVTAPTRFITRLLRNVSSVTYPLTYPNPNDQFFGYVNLTTLADGTDVEDTKNLVLVVCWITTVTVAFKSRQYVPGKGDSVRMYREHINDEWADFVESVYNTCKTKWGYVVPSDPTEREWLGQICQQMLDFENHFLQDLRLWLLAELETDRVIKALKILQVITFDDADMRQVIDSLAQSSDDAVRQSATAVRKLLSQ
jgi:predicted nucleotidyltransferase